MEISQCMAKYAKFNDEISIATKSPSNVKNSTTKLMYCVEVFRARLYKRADYLQPVDMLLYYMVSSVSGQDKPNRAL